MKIAQVMTREVLTVTPGTPYKGVVERMVAAGVSSLPVVDADGRLVGLVSEADLLSKEAYRGPRRRALAVLADLISAREHHWVSKAAGTVASDVMTAKVVVCHPADDVRAVARRMLDGGVKRMPVVDAGSLVGIVSRPDILRVFDRPDEEVAAHVDRVLSSDLNMPDDAHVRFALDHGVVTLTGDVRYDGEEPMVVDLVRAIPGVVDVVDELHHRQRRPKTWSEGWPFDVP